MNNLELRMYGMVPYNISPIQQGIQFGHAVVEYGQKMKYLGEYNQSLNTQYNDWADNWKTFIILNGGTTNNKIVDDKYLGSLNNHQSTLDKIGIFNVGFCEPDLGDQLTAIVFIVDERVFNKEKYPYFNFKIKQQVDLDNPIFSDDIEKQEWTLWVQSIGGWKNLELRNFIQNFRLA
jgi:hypothetical protein